MIRKLMTVVGLLFGSSLFCFSQKVFMLGDSHVFAKIYPEKTAEIISRAVPESEFAYWGKNGAEFSTYNKNPDYLASLYEFRPDILIVHLGTNDSYGRHFNQEYFIDTMQVFYTAVKDSLPDCKMAFVTPFINKRREGRKKGRWLINDKTRQCSRAIEKFVEEHPDAYIIDNNAEAEMNFLSNRTLIRPDNVHLTEAGYAVLAGQVGESLLKIDELWGENKKD